MFLFAQTTFRLSDAVETLTRTYIYIVYKHFSSSVCGRFDDLCVCRFPSFHQSCIFKLFCLRLTNEYRILIYLQTAHLQIFGIDINSFRYIQTLVEINYLNGVDTKLHFKRFYLTLN